MLSSKDNSGIKLWERFRAGESSALGEIFDTHILLLYKYGHKFTQDRMLVEDCIQDLFAELWKRRDRISPTTSVRFYLFRALRQKILRQLKQNTSHATLEDQFRASHEILEEVSVSEEQVSLIRNTIQTLSTRQKEVIYLKFYNRLTNDEIAGVMEIDKATVYNLVSMSLKKLRSEARVKLNAELMTALLSLANYADSIF